MPRAKKEVETMEILDKVDESKKVEISGGIPENAPKSPKSTKRVLVDSSFSGAGVVQLDAEGAELLFEQKEAFLPLEEEVIRNLSRGNRMRYSAAKQFHDSWRGEEDAAFAQSFSVDREAVGSASDKLNDLSVRSTIQERWARPDRVNAYLAKGYKVLSADEARSFLGAKGGHHEISRNGKTELVLMGIPKDLYKKGEIDKTRKNNELAARAGTQGVGDLQRLGARAFDATEEDRRQNWSELSADSE